MRVVMIPSSPVTMTTVAPFVFVETWTTEGLALVPEPRTQ